MRQYEEKQKSNSIEQVGSGQLRAQSILKSYAFPKYANGWVLGVFSHQTQ